MLEASEKGKGFKSKMTDGNGAYTYDDNGNMVTDAHKGMTVTYNFLNLPTKVTKPEGTIEWVYDAAGTKLSKTVTTERLAVNDNPMLSKEYKAQIAIESQGTVATNGDVTFTAGDSIVLKDGFTAGAGSEFLARIMPNTAVQVRDYCSGVEYFESSLEAIYFDGGRVFYAGSVTERQYVLTDYQGNTRVLFRDNGSSIAEELEGYSYYPFGMEMEGNGVENIGRENKYLFNGNELQSDFGLETYDFVNRHYDPAIGRFWQIDPLADQTNQIDKSPFAFAWNNPVLLNDPLGLSPLDDYLFDQSGNFIGVNQTNEPDRIVIINSSDCSVQCTADFNDAPNDTKFIGGELVDDQFFDKKLVTVSYSDIESVMNNNGSRTTKESPLKYIERESRPSGDESVLSGKSEGKLDHVNNPDYVPSTASLYHVEGSGKVYNAKDFGNFLWGKSGKELGFGLNTLRGAAHLNNAVNGKSDNNNPNIPILDSKTDQQAIKDGYKY